MRKTTLRILSAILCASFVFSACVAAEVTEKPQATSGLSGIMSKSAILVDENGKVLFEQNADQQRAPASVTKVMTMLLIMEALDSGAVKLTDMVTVSNYAMSMGGSQIYLKEGEQMSIDDMLKSIAVSSANDCAVAMGEHLCGTEEAFVAKMNERAAELGMVNTHFVNCNGLTAQGHVTSARDIALMSVELLKHKEILNYTQIWMDTVRDGAFGLANTNKMLKTYDGMNGLKTGFTDEAGYCLSGTATRDGLTLIAVTMGAADVKQRTADTAAMLNYGFAMYTRVEITPDTPIMPIPVLLGKKAEVECSLGKAKPLIIEKSMVGVIEKSITIAENLSAPVQHGQQVGTLRLTANGEELACVPIIANEDVEKLGIFDIFGILMKQCAMMS